MVTFTKTINESEYQFGYLNLTDNNGKKYNKEKFPPAKTPLLIKTGNKKYLASMNSNANQIWGTLGRWFKGENIHAGDTIRITYDKSKEKIDGREVVEISIEQKIDIEKKLQEHIDFVKEMMKEHFWYFYNNEENVRCEIIDPILKILGWKFPNLCREKNTIDDRTKRADYALIKDGKIQLIVEAKKMVVDASKKEELYKQTAEYCKLCKTEYGVLTNGIQWDFIKFVSNDNSHKYLSTIDLLEDEINSIINVFSLLAYNNIHDLKKMESIVFNNKDKNVMLNNLSTKTVEICINNDDVTEKNPTRTFYNAIEKIGVKKIFDLEQSMGLHRIAITGKRSEQRTYEKSKNQKLYITQDYSTATKIALLSEICTGLNMNMEIRFDKKKVILDIKDNNMVSK